MKTNLLLLRKQVSVIFLLFISVGIFGQTPLANYQFDRTLAATGATIGNPVLTYYNSSGLGTTPSYQRGGVLGLGNRMLYTTNQNSYVELTMDTTGYDGINVSWYGELSSSFLATGTWSLFVDYGSGYSNTPLLEMNLFNFIAFFSDARTEDITLDPAANNNPNLKIKIQATGISGAKLRMDNLVITSRSPKINVYGYNTSNGLSQVPEMANATTYYGSDFGIVNTDDAANPNAANRTFRITNNGAAALNISSISFTGDHPGDFSWVASPATPVPTTPTAVNAINSFPATINAGASGDFTVKFNPSADGKRSALLNITSNANPSPYSFYVEGRGSTCATTNLVKKGNTMETGQTGSGVLTATGAMNFITGNSQSNDHTPLASNQLYSHNSNTYNLYTSSSRSWYITRETSTVDFGPVDIAIENGVYISFNLAAFSTATSTDFNNNDYVELQVLKPGTNVWSPELRIRGNSNFTNENSRYSFDVGTTAETFYDGDGLYADFQNGDGVNNKYSKVKLKLPGTANFENLVFRIKAYNDSNEKLWLIDDVAVSSANIIQRKWNGTSWRDADNNAATAPDESTKSYKNFKAVFEADYTVPTSGLTICQCEVNNNINLTIPANNYLTVQTKVTNLGNGENFVIQTDGNLIQVENDAVNTGSVKVERSVNGVRNDLAQHMDYIYWSSPVSGQLLKGSTGFSPGTPPNRFYRYNEPNDFFYETGDTNFVPGKGYAIRAESGLAYGYEKTYNFKGAANNGIVNIGVQRSPNNGVNNLVQHGYNMIGNPYPSNIDFIKFYTANSTKIYNTAWFWVNDNITIYQTGNGYVGNGYAVYNGTGGNGAQTQGYAEKTPDEFIKVGQGFLVQMKIDAPIISSPTNTATLLFNNDMRAPNEGQFYSKSVNVKNRFWLKMVSSSDVASTMLLGYIPGATDDYEQDFDAESFGLSSDLLYSNLEDKRLIIQGKGNFSNEDKVAIGANFFNTGTYTISLMNPEGIFANGQAVYLKDKQTGIITKLTDGFYTFETNKGETNGRFEIIYKPETVLVSESNIKDALVVYRDSDNFVVRSPKTIATVEVYDLSGKLMTVVKADNRTAIIYASFFTKGMYVLRIKTTDGAITNKKILK